MTKTFLSLPTSLLELRFSSEAHYTSRASRGATVLKTPSLLTSIGLANVGHGRQDCRKTITATVQTQFYSRGV